MERLTLKEFAILVKAMKAVYADPRFIADDDAMKTWYAMLCDIPYAELSEAIKVYMQTEPYTPTIAGIRSKVKDLRPMEKTPLEAWGIVRDAVTRSGYGYQEEYIKLSPDIQKAVGCAENLQNWSQLNVGELDTVIQSQFLKAYSIVQKRMDESRRTSPEVAARLADLQQRVLLPTPKDAHTPKQEKEPLSPDIQKRLDRTYQMLGRVR